MAVSAARGRLGLRMTSWCVSAIVTAYWCFFDSFCISVTVSRLDIIFNKPEMDVLQVRPLGASWIGICSFDLTIVTSFYCSFYSFCVSVAVSTLDVIFNKHEMSGLQFRQMGAIQIGNHLLIRIGDSDFLLVFLLKFLWICYRFDVGRIFLSKKKVVDVSFGR
jgi:hypothetical protein